MSKCREAFEELYGKQELVRSITNPEFYADFEVTRAWRYWQAAWNAATKNAVLEAQKKQEPVAFIETVNPRDGSFRKSLVWKKNPKPSSAWCTEYTPLYAAPVVQEKQEPVAWMVVTADDKLVFINANQAEHYAKQWELEVCPLFAAPVVQPDMIRPDQEALQQIIAAALYDFGGFITTRQKQLVASATDNAADTVEALKEFMEKRGINPCQDVPVLSWQCWIAAADGKSNAVADSRPD